MKIFSGMVSNSKCVIELSESKRTLAIYFVDFPKEKQTMLTSQFLRALEINTPTTFGQIVIKPFYIYPRFRAYTSVKITSIKKAYTRVIEYITYLQKRRTYLHFFTLEFLHSSTNPHQSKVSTTFFNHQVKELFKHINE